MIAVLRWTDGFGNDTYVKAIYPSLEQAKRDFWEGDRWVEFNYGFVDFEWYEANEFKGVTAQDDDKPDEPDEDFEIGYNPYLGCFDFDC